MVYSEFQAFRWSFSSQVVAKNDFSSKGLKATDKQKTVRPFLVCELLPDEAYFQLRIAQQPHIFPTSYSYVTKIFLASFSMIVSKHSKVAWTYVPMSIWEILSFMSFSYFAMKLALHPHWALALVACNVLFSVVQLPSRMKYSSLFLALVIHLSFSASLSASYYLL